MVLQRLLPFEEELIQSYINDFYTHTGKKLKVFVDKKKFKLSLQELYNIVEGLNFTGKALNSRWRPRELADLRKIFCMISIEREFPTGKIAESINRHYTTPSQLANEGAKLLEISLEFQERYEIVRKTIKNHEDRHNEYVQAGANAESALPACL
jgi:hypothetical protein